MGREWAKARPTKVYGGCEIKIECEKSKDSERINQRTNETGEKQTKPFIKYVKHVFLKISHCVRIFVFFIDAIVVVIVIENVEMSPLS